MAFDSFRDFIAQLDRAGELIRISQPVATVKLFLPIFKMNFSEIVDSVRPIIEPTPAGDWHSVCLCSNGSHGIEGNLICSFPVHSNSQKLEIVQDIPINEFSRAKIDAPVNELKEERAMISDLLPK
jgi:hypothetical protein